MSAHYTYELPTATHRSQPKLVSRSELTFSTATSRADPSIPPPSRNIPPGGDRRTFDVEPPAPSNVRPTRLGLALLGVLAAIAFCLLLWGVLLALNEGVFITALVSVCAAWAALCLIEKTRK